MPFIHMFELDLVETHKQPRHRDEQLETSEAEILMHALSRRYESLPQDEIE